MKYCIPIILLFVFACKSGKKENEKADSITGGWLVLDASYQLKGKEERIHFRNKQDSLAGFITLVPIYFRSDSSFMQPDSINLKGKWSMSKDSIFSISNGGAGFENCVAKISRYAHQEMELTQPVQTELGSKNIIWILRRLEGADTSLFAAEKNNWRIKPKAPETDKQLRQRLASMLGYYIAYFEFVEKKADFFSSYRLLVPLETLQGDMDMAPFEEAKYFIHCFFDNKQAKQAYDELSRVLHDTYFWTGADSYLIEYVDYMKKIKTALERL